MDVRFYQTLAGGSPVVKWLKTLTGRDADEVRAAILALQASGLSAPGLDLKHIDGKLWEIRTPSQRVFYVVVTGPALVLLHGYKKQGQKAPVKELDVARDRAKQVLGK
jgi:phage-related protein